MIGIISGSILAVVGAAGYISIVLKEKKSKAKKEKEPTDKKEVSQDVLNVLSAIDNCRKGRADKKDTSSIEDSPLGETFARFMANINRSTICNNWVDDLEKEVNKNLHK